ncbi:hypothetical protein [Corynebacterium xerosis]|uniref:DUF4282 domain-containing protein n=1 Tax=Corynebacterium xerosis TaxID=1725 RepID=A0ABV3UUJ4_9CORY
MMRNFDAREVGNWLRAKARHAREFFRPNLDHPMQLIDRFGVDLYRDRVWRWAALIVFSFCVFPIPQVMIVCSSEDTFADVENFSILAVTFSTIAVAISVPVLVWAITPGESSVKKVLRSIEAPQRIPGQRKTETAYSKFAFQATWSALSSLLSALTAAMAILFQLQLHVGILAVVKNLPVMVMLFFFFNGFGQMIHLVFMLARVSDVSERVADS